MTATVEATDVYRLLDVTDPGWTTHLRTCGSMPESAPRTLLAELAQSGLRGRGGGWFPTVTKLQAVQAANRSSRRPGGRPTVVGNAVESEPVSAKDVVLLSRHPQLVLDGLAVTAAAIGAREAVLALGADSPVAGIVRRALNERPDAANFGVTLHLRTVPHGYLSSEESALVAGLDGRPAIPVTVRPIQRGLHRRPTAVLNAETLAHVGGIARTGGSAFAGVGVPQAPGTTLVTIAGAVARPGVVEVPTGTTIADLLSAAGGVTDDIRGYLTGGYGGTWVGSYALGAGWDPFALTEVGAVPGAGILLALPHATCPIAEVARVSAWLANSSAGQCGPCRFGTAAVAQSMAQLAAGRLTDAEAAALRPRLAAILGRGACKLPDGASRFVSTALDVFADEVGFHLSGRCSAPRSVAGPVLPLPAARAVGSATGSAGGRR